MLHSGIGVCRKFLCSSVMFAVLVSGLQLPDAVDVPKGIRISWKFAIVMCEQRQSHPALCGRLRTYSAFLSQMTVVRAKAFEMRR
jgi:hypothetical protein